MPETSRLKKKQKSKQYLKITISQSTVFEKTQKSKQYLKITMSEINDLEKRTQKSKNT